MQIVEGQLLDDLAVAGGIEMAHVIAVHQVELAVFAGRHQQVRMRGAAD